MNLIIKRLKEVNRWNISKALFLMSCFCFFLSLTRIYFTGTPTYLFLNWNLFLAFLPWAATTCFIIQPKVKGQKGRVWAILFCWLVFFPNAPYILTDLFHLRLNDSAPIWFDLILIMSFAWTGLIYGFVSLMDLQEMLEKWMRPGTLKIMIALFLFLSAFGIYIGRYLRWNSWDIMRHPISLFGDIKSNLLHTDSERAWGMTILMGIMLNMMYWTFHQFKKTKVVEVSSATINHLGK